MGTRAFSHDSIFIPDGEADDEQDIQTLSQECIGGKVRSLQQQIAKNIRFGQPPANLSGKRMQDMDTSAEEMDDTQVSPVEIIGHQDMGLQENTVLTSRSPYGNVPETDRKAEDMVTPLKMSRHKRHQASSGTIESINLDAVPRSAARLDNSAAKHKLSVKPKNQRVSKKHRGMSQCIEDTEHENEPVFTMKNSSDKTMYYQKEKSIPDMMLSDTPDHKSAAERTSDMVRTPTESPKAKEVKPLEETKPRTPVHLIYEYESRTVEEKRSVRLKAQQDEEEEEKKRQELEKIRHMLEEQKENELKEQRLREEECKKRAEQCLKELEEHRKREEQKQRELEEQRTHQQAEVKPLGEDRQRKEKQQKTEEQNQQQPQPHEILDTEIMPETEVTKKQKEICFSEPVMTFVEEDHYEIQKMSEEPNPDELEAAHAQRKETEAQEQERLGRELRWQGFDQRQRPFTFQVSSGEKQIIFGKVNLSPLKDPFNYPDTQGDNKPSLGSHALQSNQSVPHTAILVTGAQLCDPAENPIQIKDTACKSLLGLTEEKKQLENPAIKNEKQNAKQIGIKTQYTSDSQELASIRTKILSKSENILEKDRGGARICSDDWTDKGKSDSHSNLRKTMSATARFSITPARQKFAEPVNPTEGNIDKTSKENVATMKNIFSESEAPKSTGEIQEIVSHKTKKQVTIDSKTESWIFSKDLPSFLVPNPPQSPRKLQKDNENSSENQMSNGIQKTDKLVQNGEETITTFGITLRRTNYSLRFSGDPQNEQKKKKRYSAGDSFDGVSVPFMASGKIDIEPHGCRRTMSASSTVKDTVVNVLLDTSNDPSDDLHPTSVPSIPASITNVASPNKDATVPRTPIVQKPSLAPKPSSPTPSLSSPQSRLNRANVFDLSSQVHDKCKEDKEIMGVDIKVNTVVSALSVNKEEIEVKDKKFSFPSIPIPWRDKSEKKPDYIGKEKPVLQSRHSIDSRLMEKVETAQPLWIMLALQKQKGFREQQAHREERRHARETKHADKVTKENAPSIQAGEYRGRSGSLQKLSAPEEKTTEPVKTRLQRREQLQKSNTLPTSATVDITETVPGSPQTRDDQKRYSTPNAAAVTSEPDWMALAKRKSMAWKDSPQIIK